MAQGKKISELTEVSSVTDNDEFLFVDKEGSGANSGVGGQTAKIKFSDLKSAVGAGTTGAKGASGDKGMKGESGPRGLDGTGTQYWTQSPTDGDAVYYNAGNVGVGTDDPQMLFHTYVADSYNQLIIESGLEGSKAGYQLKTPEGKWILENRLAEDETESDLVIRQSGGTTPGEKFVVKHTSGNVGIGPLGASSNAGDLLHISTTGLSCGLTLHAETKQAKLVANSAGSLELKAGNGGNAPEAKMVFEVNNAEAMRIRTDGNVGIGTSNPTAPLTIVEKDNVAFKMLKSSGQTMFTIGEDGGGNVVLDSTYIDLNGNVNPNSGDIIIKGKNVGIGTESPSKVLTINHVHPGIRFEDADGDPAHVTQIGSYNGTMYFDSDMANPDNTAGRTAGKGFVFRTDVNTTETPSGNELLVIRQEGHVGIGELNPSKQLHLKCTTESDVAGLGQPEDEVGIHFTSYDSSQNACIKHVREDKKDRLEFSCGGFNMAQMSLNNQGNFGIGTTSPSSLLTVESGEIGKAQVKISAVGKQENGDAKPAEIVINNDKVMLMTGVRESAGHGMNSSYDELISYIRSQYIQDAPAEDLGKFAPIRFGPGSGAVAEINDYHISYKGNTFTRFNPVTSFMVGNCPWGELTDKSWADWFTYDPNYQCMKVVGGARTIIVRTRMPVDRLGTYRITVRAKQIKANSGGGEDSFYCGVACYDHGMTFLSTDQAKTYNYGVAINYQTMKNAIGETKTFTGDFSGFNDATQGDHNKFDQAACFFDVVILTGYTSSTDLNAVSDSETLIDYLEVKKLDA